MANPCPILVGVGGIIYRAPITFEADHPMVRSKSHLVSALIVRHYHHILGHTGPEHALSVVLQR